MKATGGDMIDNMTIFYIGLFFYLVGGCLSIYDVYLNKVVSYLMTMFGMLLASYPFLLPILENPDVMNFNVSLIFLSSAL